MVATPLKRRMRPKPFGQCFARSRRRTRPRPSPSPSPRGGDGGRTLAGIGALEGAGVARAVSAFAGHLPTVSVTTFTSGPLSRKQPGLRPRQRNAYRTHDSRALLVVPFPRLCPSFTNCVKKPLMAIRPQVELKADSGSGRFGARSAARWTSVYSPGQHAGSPFLFAFLRRSQGADHLHVRRAESVPKTSRVVS